MVESEEGVKRVLQIKMRALGDAGQVLTLIRSAAPFYRTLGGTSFRVLQNVDDRAQLLIEIEYEAHAARMTGAYQNVIPYDQSIRPALLETVQRVDPRQIAINGKVKPQAVEAKVAA